MEKPQEKQLSIRFPLDLFDWISQQAKENKRSFNAQVIWLLEHLYQQEQKKS